MSDPLSGLKIEHWWHAFTIVGGAGFVASIAITSQYIHQRDLILLSMSLFLFGIGQWINHPIQQGFIGNGIITAYDRRPYPLGVALEWLGVVIFLVEVVRVAIAA
jgi:hypothetical protein